MLFPIKNHQEVLSYSQIETILAKIRENLSLWYFYPEKVSVAFGHFIDGVCLIYIDEFQAHLNDDFGFVERNKGAKYAINERGEFISFKVGSLKLDGFERVVGEKPAYIHQFELVRCVDVSGENVSTNDFRRWEWDNELKPSSYIKLLLKTSETNKNFKLITPRNVRLEDDYENIFYSDDYDEDSEEQERADDDFCFAKYLIDYSPYTSYNTLMKLDCENDTNYIVNKWYLLLCDNIHGYFGDEWEWDDPIERYYHFYQEMFDRYKMKSDIMENRYGVYDIYSHKTIIHCGEMAYTVAYINGFPRIDFTNNQILTFDFLDISNNKGVPYKPKIEVKNGSAVIVNCATGRSFSYAQNEIYRYMSVPERRSGLYAGEWYILREGPYAGCTIYWMLRNKLEYIISLIRKDYIFLHDFSEYKVFGESDKASYKSVTLALDSRTPFEDITNVNQPLDVESPFSQSRICERIGTSWCPPTIEEMIEDDYKYLCALIKARSLYIAPNVIEELEEAHSNDRSYQRKLAKVKAEAEKYHFGDYSLIKV